MDAVTATAGNKLEGGESVILGQISSTSAEASLQDMLYAGDKVSKTTSNMGSIVQMYASDRDTKAQTAQVTMRKSS